MIDLKPEEFVDDGKRRELHGIQGKRMPIPYDKTTDSKYGHVYYAFNAQLHAPSRRYCCEKCLKIQMCLAFMRLLIGTLSMKKKGPNSVWTSGIV